MIKTNKLKSLLLTSLIFTSSMANAGVTVYKQGDKYVKIGGRIQVQYYSEDNGDVTIDEVKFRRLRPYIEASLYKDWKGKIQWDMGKASGDNEISIKDAYFQYSGFNNIKLKIGNALFPFSREQLTSSKKQGLVERTFVGDHNYGSPDRNLGIHATGKHGMFDWGFSIASAAIDPSNSKIDFDTPVNQHNDFNQGTIIGGRIEWNVIGNVKYSQSNFSGKNGLAFALAAYNWNNDNDNNSSENSLDSIKGIELSAAWRWRRASVDVQYNTIKADAINPDLSSGLFVNGSTELENYAIEAAYMIVPNKIELVVAYSEQDADGYAEAWERTAFGINYYIKKHDIKLQLSIQDNANVDGVSGADKDEVFLQAQYVF